MSGLYRECNVFIFSRQFLCFYVPSFERLGSILDLVCARVSPSVRSTYGLET